MADKPGDNKPATEFGEVKVIKNEPKAVDPGKTPGTAEAGVQGEPTGDLAGKTPGRSEG